MIVKFAGHFGLTVGYRATLQAVGTEQDRIVFTPIDNDEGWFGIRFINSAGGGPAEVLHARVRHEAPHRRGQL